MRKNLGRVWAFIDANNLHLGIKSQGWVLDWKKFRVYLREKYGVSEAIVFIGDAPNRQELHRKLESFGYRLVKKPVISGKDGEAKANVDADLVLEAALHWNEYGKAVLVSNDGDFYSLVRAWRGAGKLLAVVSPHRRYASWLLRKEAGDFIRYLEPLQSFLERNKSL